MVQIEDIIRAGLQSYLKHNKSINISYNLLLICGSEVIYHSVKVAVSISQLNR